MDRRWVCSLFNTHKESRIRSQEFAPGEKHWHGAAPATAMSHIAIQETHDGKAVEGLEHVSDEQYQK